jgi:hypothetical protein
LGVDKVAQDALNLVGCGRGESRPRLAMSEALQHAACEGLLLRRAAATL